MIIAALITMQLPGSEASAAAAAVGGGLAQLPGSDAIPITAAQVTMIISLGSVFGKSITEALGWTAAKKFDRERG